jgi:hypothetical protein
MSFTQSRTLIVLAAQRTGANRIMEALGRGPGTFSVPLVPIATPDVAPTHYAAHTYDDALDQGEALLATLPAAVLTRVRISRTVATAAWSAVRQHAKADRSSTANFADAIAARGLMIKPVVL